MGSHSFSLDPRTILDVGPDASLDEIHDAYRAKSKKHHPDLGGDEWAFRMVTRAYEVLRTTAVGASSARWRATAADVGQHSQAPDWGRIWTRPPHGPDFESRTRHGSSPTADAGAGARRTQQDDDHSAAPSASEPCAHRSPITEPDELRTVEVELIWTRFEKEVWGRLDSEGEADETTLSVCMVISWPEYELVDHAAEFGSVGELLRTLIDVFERLRAQERVVAGRSRIEDGRFVGLLSYADVPTAQDAFLTLRDALQARGLTVKLSTRDERVPFERSESRRQPVMPHTA
jgi:hypothetical protein